MSSLEKSEGPIPDLAGASVPDRPPEANDLSEVDRGAVVISSPSDHKPERRGAVWGRKITTGSFEGDVLSEQTEAQALEPRLAAGDDEGSGDSEPGTGAEEIHIEPNDEGGAPSPTGGGEGGEPPDEPPGGSREDKYAGYRLLARHVLGRQRPLEPVEKREQAVDEYVNELVNANAGSDDDEGTVIPVDFGSATPESSEEPDAPELSEPPSGSDRPADPPPDTPEPAAREFVREIRHTAADTTYSPYELPQTDIYDRVRSLGVPLDNLVVVGSSALEVVVGPDVRRAHDLDIVVPEEVYNELRSRHDMEETVYDDGYRHLRNEEGFDIATTRGGMTVDELRARGFTNEGITVAGLPDIYHFLQEQGRPENIRDLETIRERLFSNSPLPPIMLEQERAFLESIMPRRVHGRPELHVGANGLYLVRTLYGDESGTVRTYSGEVEQGVPATYHGWEHTAYGTRDGQRTYNELDVELAIRLQGQEPSVIRREMEQLDQDRVISGTSFPNHDAHQGHGRMVANPEGHDEIRSADLQVRHLEAVGVTDNYVLEGSHVGIVVTRFNPYTRGQDIDERRGFPRVQRVNSGSDMSAFRREDAARNAMRLIPEELSQGGGAYDRPLIRLLDNLNSRLPEGAPRHRIRTVEDGLRYIDENPDFPVTKTVPGKPPQQMTLLEAAADHLAGSEGFISRYQFSPQWGTGTPEAQAESAAFAGDLARQVKEGRISTTEAYQKTNDYIRERQSEN